MYLLMEYITDGSGFRRIEPLSINPGNLTDFTIYEKQRLSDGQYRFRCLLADPGSIKKERLIQLLHSWDSIYIHESQEIKYQQYLKDNLDYFLTHDGIDVSNKTGALINLSTDVVTQYFQTNFGDPDQVRQSLKKVEQLIGQAIAFIIDTNSLDGIAKLVGHDYDTHTHSIKVGWLMATFVNFNKDLFADEYGADFKQFLVQVVVAGFLHDIGKIKVPKNILGKNGKLNNLEYIVVQCHTAYSASLLFDAGLAKPTMQAILYHHENEDGSGYPCGLPGDQTPVMAKICHIADVFDALTSSRSYKRPRTPFEALKIMSGQNPQLKILHQFESEAAANLRPPISALVRDDYDAKLRRLREREMIEEEAAKRVEARMRLRDQGMSHCFDLDLLRRFIVTINRSESFDLSGLL